MTGRGRILPVLLALALLPTGCGGTVPAEPEPFSPVHTDWSHLTPYEPGDELYTYFEPYSGSGPLQARSDYGPLLPYAGRALDRSYFLLYGLVTARGELVTEPVYDRIEFLTDGTGAARFLYLQRTEVPADMSYPEADDDGWDDSVSRVIAAAPDGSWVLDGDYRSAACVDSTHLALFSEDGTITVVDETGAATAVFPADALAAYLDCGFSWDSVGSPHVFWRGGQGLVYTPNNAYEFPVCRLDPTDGSIHPLSPEEGAQWELWSADNKDRPEIPGYVTTAPLTDPFTGTAYLAGRRYSDSTSWDLLSEDGTLLYEDFWRNAYYQDLMVLNGLAGRIEGGYYCYRSITDQSLVFRYPIRTNSD